MRGIVAAAVAAALAACALLLPSCASGEATVLPLAGGEAAVSEDGAASEAESGGATEAKASDDPEDPGDAEASAADLDEADEGASPEGLEPTGDELAARMDAYLAANFPRAGAPGLAVAVVDAGGVRYLRTFGDCPDADAPFVVGSLSKSFTAVAVMQLVEQGAVDLDAPASRYAPGYDVPDEVTVRSLLNQTSGFGAYDSLAEAADGELGETFGAFSYANANYDLLGRVVEGASGEDYACYLDEHVLEPLGMASTTADPARAEALGMVPGHRDWFGLPVPKGAFYSIVKLPVDDAEKFAQWLLEEFDYNGQTVMLAPASGFYYTPGLGKNEVRIAYVLKISDLQKAMEILSVALKTYPGKTL